MWSLLLHSGLVPVQEYWGGWALFLMVAGLVPVSLAQAGDWLHPVLVLLPLTVE